MAEEPDAEPLDQPEEEEGGPVKSFLEHLEDLRWVLIKSLVGVALGMLICLFGGNHVVRILTRPLARARMSFPGTNQVLTLWFGTNQLGVLQLDKAYEEAFRLGTNRFVSIRLEPGSMGTNQVVTWHVDEDPALAERAQRLKMELMTLGPAAGFFVAFQVAMYGGLVLASPFVFYFVAAFVFPALKMRERYYVYRGLGFGIGLFFTGVVFCYFALVPLALAASQRYSQWLSFSAYQWKADEYISFVCKFMLGMGLGFEMPVVILTLVKIGVLNYQILRSARRYVIVIAFVLGAVLTTPEVITQVLMAIPLLLLYEISVWITWYWEWRDKKREQAGASE